MKPMMSHENQTACGHPNLKVGVFVTLCAPDVIEAFLMERGFSQVHSVTSHNYKKAYFHEANEGRYVELKLATDNNKRSVILKQVD